jgi:membrane dipeptidase
MPAEPLRNAVRKNQDASHPSNARHPKMPDQTVPVFDGHNDVLLRLHLREGPDAVASFMTGNGKGQLDFPRAREGGFAGGMFAIFVPSPQRPRPDSGAPKDVTDEPFPLEVDLARAQKAVLAMASLLFRIESQSNGQVRVCRSIDDIKQCIADGVLAPVLHIEGAEAIDPEFQALEVLHKAGLRSLGPVWSRSNIFGHGVPFSFPSSPDTGPGLTDAGKELVRACNRLRILIDLSHLNEKGFWDVAALSDAPLVATHSNAHAVCNHARNLTDKQLDAIKDSGGMVGVNYAVNFLRPDGKRDDNTPLDQVVDHIEYLIKRLGEDHVGLGSDFDGATIPKDLSSAAALPNLVAAMRARQFGEALIKKVCTENWLKALERTWGTKA